MSLKSRLLNKKVTGKKLPSIDFEEEKTVAPVSVFDIINYFETNSEISALYIYAPDKIFVEKNGIIHESDLFFDSNERILSIINSIANQYDKIINLQNPSFSIVLVNGIKINALIPPLVEKNPYLALQKTQKYSQKNNNMISEKLISNEMILFLKECLKMNLNIFVTGNANVDKTVFLNYLANNLQDDESIITIEKTPQLKPKNPCCLKLIKHKNNFQKVIKKALKLKHDRIIVSNADITELITLYEYINAGHNGFLISFSTKTYNEIIQSLQNLILLSHPNIVEQNANALLAASMDIFVNISKTKDGQERITNIGEIIKTKTSIKIQDLFVWKESRIKTKKFNGEHVSTGTKSRFFNEETSPTISFKEDYFSKDCKHNYINTEVIETTIDKPLPIKKANPAKIKKYKILKEKAKNKK